MNLKLKLFLFALASLTFAVLLQASQVVVPVPERPPTPPEIPLITAGNASSPWNPVTMIALASMVISLVSCGWMIWGHRQTATKDYVAELEKKIEALHEELELAEARIGHLEEENTRQLRENIELLRRLAQMPSK